MGRKSSHWIRSLISVFVLAIVIFLVIYFFYPEVSLKFFGIGFKTEDRVSKALENILVDNLDVSEAEAGEYLESADGREAIKEVVNALKKGAKDIGTVISKDELRQIAENISNGTDGTSSKSPSGDGK